MPVVVLFTIDGDHVPVMPFKDIRGKVGAADPLQIGVIGLKVGVTLLLTVTVSVVVVAHCPASGVNV